MEEDPGNVKTSSPPDPQVDTKETPTEAKDNRVSTASAAAAAITTTAAAPSRCFCNPSIILVYQYNLAFQ